MIGMNWMREAVGIVQGWRAVDGDPVRKSFCCQPARSGVTVTGPPGSGPATASDLP